MSAVALAASPSRFFEVTPDIQAGLERCRDDANFFVERMLGGRPTPFQAGALADLSKFNRVACHTGHGCGKTTLEAWSALWFSATRPYSIVIDTAPTFTRQVKKIFWPELRRWAKKLPAPQGFDLQATRLVWDEDGWFITGESAAEGENIAGFHSRRGGIMYICDEDSGIEDEIHEAIEGALTDSSSDYRILIAGNPTKRSGELYRAKTDPKHRWSATNPSGYRFHHQSSWDSPLVSRAWCEERRAKWGENSTVYRVRVLGLPPEESADTLIPFHLIQASVDRWKENAAKPGPARLGVDVARFGDDDSVVARRVANRLCDLHPVNGYASGGVADLVKYVGALNAPDRVDVVAVDGIGYGSGVVDELRRRKTEKLSDVNVAMTASDGEMFENLRAELCWSMRDWFLEGKAEIPDDEMLVQELSELKMSLRKTGKTAIEPKETMKIRIGRSPDRADALMLTFAGPQATKAATASRGGPRSLRGSF